MSNSPPTEIPDYQTLMLPVLQEASVGEVRITDVVAKLAEKFNLSPEQRAQLIPSGAQSLFSNRVHWARAYLKKGGLIEATKRAYIRITDRGEQVLKSNPDRIDVNFLRQYPEFEKFVTPNESKKPTQLDVVSDSTLTPDEEMRRANSRIEAELGNDILAKVLQGPPSFFEQVVVKLVTAMGYGGSVADAGKALGQSGDGGVDGVINEDELGLDRIYVQAKRYKDGNSVGSGAIRDFFGALDQFKAGKGLFVTTSTFSSSAVKTAEGLSKRIVLVDGARLAQLMIKYDVGCRVEEVLSIKRLDEDFFDF